MERPVRTVIYARQSQDRTGSGIAIERQIESCGFLARARDWELTYPPLVDNDVSAYSGAKRPAFDQLMTTVELVRIARDAKVKIASVAGD